MTIEKMKDIIKRGESIRTDAGEIVTDPDRLEDALAEAAALPAPKRAIYPSLDELVDARAGLEVVTDRLAQREAELDIAANALAAAVGDKASLADANTDLTTQVSTLNADNALLTNSSMALTAEVEALKKSGADAQTTLQAQITDLQKQLATATKKGASAPADTAPPA